MSSDDPGRPAVQVRTTSEFIRETVSELQKAQNRNEILGDALLLCVAFIETHNRDSDERRRLLLRVDAALVGKRLCV